MVFLAHLLCHPGITGMVVGKDYGQLVGVQWRMILRVLKWWAMVNQVELVRTASAYQKRIELINGSVILFRSSTEIERIQGLQIQAVWADEWAIWADQRGSWNEIHARLRSDDGGVLRGIWTSTPKGAYGIAAILLDKARNVIRPKVWQSDHAPEDQPYLGYSLFQMSTRDNPVFDASYVDSLLSNYSTDEAKQELDGEILTLAGSVFGHVFSPIHNVIPFVVDPGKHGLVAAIDHGSNYPYCALIARHTDATGQPADCVIAEFVKDGIRGVQEIVWWLEQRMRELKASKLLAIYPDPDKQYRRENALLATHFKCPVHAYETRDYRNISWGTGLVKARLQDAKGDRHLFVSRDLAAQDQNTAVNGRGCVRGFVSQEWAENRSSKNVFEELSDQWKDQPGTHGMDAIRYFISHEYKYLAADGSYRKGAGMTVYR